MEPNFAEFVAFVEKSVQEILLEEKRVLAHLIMAKPEVKTYIHVPMLVPKPLWRLVATMAIKDARPEYYAFVSDTWMIKGNLEELKKLDVQPRDHPQRQDAVIISAQSCTGEQQAIVIEYKKHDNEIEITSIIKENIELVPNIIGGNLFSDL
ncbi:MAG: hypothetical protein ABID61_04960 [Candidatus Micrarchaeota archaeon]